jgi:hypothetical protein
VPHRPASLGPARNPMEAEQPYEDRNVLGRWRRNRRPSTHPQVREAKLVTVTLSDKR